MSEQVERHGIPPFPTRLPRLRRAAARLLAALALRHRRCGAGRVGVDRPPARGRTKLVAGAAARSDRVRQLALSIPVVLRRQRAADQPGGPDRRRTARRRRVRRTVVSGGVGRLRRGHPVQNELLQTAWTNFSAGARADLRGDFDEFCQRQAHWLDDYALFRALKARYRGAYYLEWPARCWSAGRRR